MDLAALRSLYLDPPQVLNIGDLTTLYAGTKAILLLEGLGSIETLAFLYSGKGS